MAKKTESNVARTILQRPQQIAIGGKIYETAPPSVATLIMVSELVSELPLINTETDNILSESLRVAKDCKVLGDIVATMVLGAKGVTDKREVESSRLFGLLKTKRTENADRRSELANELLNEMGPRELSKIAVQVLSGMEVSDFFGLTASLAEVNLLRPTTETTASGPRSEER